MSRLAAWWRGARGSLAVGVVVVAFVVGTVALTVNTIDTRRTVNEIRQVQLDRAFEERQIAKSLAILVEFQHDATNNHTNTHALLVAICRAIPGCVVPPA